MRLDKFLADCGVGTRSEIKKLIKGGFITVSGKDKLKPEMQIDEAADEVYAYGKRLVYNNFSYFFSSRAIP